MNSGCKGPFRERQSKRINLSIYAAVSWCCVLRRPWLHPEIGRWTTKDPIGFSGGTNIMKLIALDIITILQVH